MSIANERSVGGRGFLAADDDDDSLIPIHGVALGSNDITRGHLSGERKLWTPEVLKDAARTLEGKQIVIDHENRSVRKVIGEVTDSRFKEGTGVIYQGQINDDEIAEKIGRGWLDVSPRIIHSEEMEERENVKIPEKIHRFDNLSIVTTGASKSNSADLGEHSELMSVEELREAFDEDATVSEFQKRIDENQDFDLRKHLYETPEGAQGALEGLDCEQGVHEHVVDGKTWFMPCETHDKFLQAMGNKESEENMGCGCSCGSRTEELLRSEARRPDYDGTETTSWGDVDASTLEHYTSNLDYDAESWDDLTQEQRNKISSHTLLGDPDADTASEGIFFPVVNASSGSLNRGALEAVRSGRGQSADIPSGTYESAFSMAGRLLNEEFNTDVETNIEEMTDGDTNPDDLNDLVNQIVELSDFEGCDASDVMDSLENLRDGDGGEGGENGAGNENGSEHDSSEVEAENLSAVLGMSRGKTI